MTVDNTKTTRRGGDLLVASLLAQKVDRAFCVPGESYLPVLDALHDVSDQIDLVVCRHESGAANMAEAYGKLTGRPGVCFVTRGPGATNASTGIHTAFQDSTPLVLFVGQVNSSMKHREGFQEVDFAAMFTPLAKWAAEITDPARIPEYVHRAFQTAMAGRPGPVVLSLPEDILSDLVSSEIDPGLLAAPISGAPTEGQLSRIAELVEAAERPLLIVGGGDWTAVLGEQVAGFAERFGVPIAASLRCQDYVNNYHPNYVGHLTIGAEPKLVERVRQADLLIVMGARLGEMTTAGYTIIDPAKRGAMLVHIYPDPEELGRVYQANLAINAGAPATVEGLARLQPKTGNTKRGNWVAEARADYVASLAVTPRETSVDLAQVVTEIRKAVPADTIVCSGAGNYTAWAHRFWQFSSFRTQLAPTSGAMGYGVPAAIAASLIYRDRTVVCFAGDGCFQMSSQELATAAQFGARVLFVVVNNSMLGTIRMHQEREFPGRVYATDLVNPDFVALARSYGLAAERVEHTADFGAALQRALAAKGSALIEVVTEKEAISHRTTISAMREKAKASQK
nr:thiamine pyrophosphate-binding protein [Devosia submarina]